MCACTIGICKCSTKASYRAAECGVITTATALARELTQEATMPQVVCLIPLTLMLGQRMTIRLGSVHPLQRS